MAPNLLTIPPEIRLRILEYAVVLEPTIICKHWQDHRREYYRTDERWPVRRLDSSPYLYLYLICSRITNELKCIDIPLLELQMCKPECVSDYFKKWRLMGSRARSVQTPFQYFLAADADETSLKRVLLLYGKGWPSRVDVTYTEAPSEIFTYR